MKRQNYISAIILCCILGTTAVSNAQKKDLVTPFRQGSATINFGVGAGNDYKNDFRGSHGTFGTKVAFEYGIWNAGPGVVSLGASVGGSFSRGSYENDFRSRRIVVAGRSAWHYGWKVSRLDTYAGFSAGVGFYHSDYNQGQNNIDLNDTDPVFAGFIGASYFLSPSFALNVEAGNDINNIQAGVVIKF